MKRLLAITALLIPIYLFAQGFGSFSHDQPFLAGSQSSSVPSLLPNLFEYWKMDYSPNGVVLLGSVGTTNLVISGLNIATNQVGIISNSVHIAGSSSGILYNQHPVMDSKSNSFSVTMWFYNGGPVDESNGQTLVGRWDPGASNFKWTLFYSTPSPDGLAFYWQNGAGTLANTTLFPRGVMTNQWVFLSVGWDLPSQKMWWSTNGASKIENTMLYGFSSSPLAFEIGNVNSGNQGLVAYIDEIGYWTNTLSNSDINYLYNGGAGRTYPFLP